MQSRNTVITLTQYLAATEKPRHMSSAVIRIYLVFVPNSYTAFQKFWITRSKECFLLFTRVLMGPTGFIMLSKVTPDEPLLSLSGEMARPERPSTNRRTETSIPNTWRGWRGWQTTRCMMKLAHPASKGVPVFRFLKSCPMCPFDCFWAVFF